MGDSPSASSSDGGVDDGGGGGVCGGGDAATRGGRGAAAPSTSTPRAPPPPRPTGVPVFVALPPGALLGDAWVATAPPAAPPASGAQLPDAVADALAAAAAAGAAGVAVDLWWGAVEAAPRAYDWRPAVAVVRAAAAAGLGVQANLCFHSPDAGCGGGGGGAAYGGGGVENAEGGTGGKGQSLSAAGAPLPGWVVDASTAAGLWHVDAQGREHTQCLSLAADTVPFLPSFPVKGVSASSGGGGHVGGRSRRHNARGAPLRTALTAAGDALRSFLTALPADVAAVVGRVQLGAGPRGELAYPAHVPPPAGEWAYPGVGSFVCHSPRSVAAAAAAAAAAGVPPSWATPPSVAAAGGPAVRPRGFPAWATRGGDTLYVEDMRFLIVS